MAIEVEELTVILHCKGGGKIRVYGETNAVLEEITDLMLKGTEKDFGRSITVGEDVKK